MAIEVSTARLAPGGEGWFRVRPGSLDTSDLCLANELFTKIALIGDLAGAITVAAPPTRGDGGRAMEHPPQSTVVAPTACPRGWTPAGCLPDHLERLLEPISKGLSNQQIADKLFLTLHTVENHVSELKSHCCYDSRVQLVLQFQGCLALQKSKELAP